MPWWEESQYNPRETQDNTEVAVAPLTWSPFHEASRSWYVDQITIVDS